MKKAKERPRASGREAYTVSRRIALCLLLPLAGCGLRPLLAGPEGEVVALEFAGIQVDTPETPLGYALKTQLVQNLNPKGLEREPRYRLVVTTERRRKALGIQLDDTTTRYDLDLAARVRLSPLGAKPDDPPLLRTIVRRTASFNVLRQPFATLIAERDAEERAALEIALQIRTQLAVYFEERLP